MVSGSPHRRIAVRPKIVLTRARIWLHGDLTIFPYPDEHSVDAYSELVKTNGNMTTILVPFHQDERLPDGDIPVPADVTVLPELPEAERWRRLAVLGDATAAAVAQVVAAGRVPTVFSGDCLVAGGTLAGVQRAGVDPALVWFDAHGDVHTLHTTTSGYLGGLALRLLMGEHADVYAELIGLRPLSPGRVRLIDGRDLDPAEVDYLAAGTVRRIPVRDLLAETVPCGPLMLHVDVDVIDPDEVPGLRFPAPGGPSADCVLAACGRLLATGRVFAFNVACPWWPAGGDEEHGIRAGILSRLAELPGLAAAPASRAGTWTDRS